MKKVLSKKEKARRQTIRRSPKIKQAIRRLDPSRILTLDLETTGLTADAEIIQLSIMNGCGDVLMNRYFKPLYTERWDEAMEVNHITPEQVAQEDPFILWADTVSRLFMDADLIVGYSTFNDIAKLHASGVVLPDKDIYLDLAEAFSLIHYQETKTITYEKLMNCAAHYGYHGRNWHDSLTDTDATLFCFQHMLDDDQAIFKKRRYRRSADNGVSSSQSYAPVIGVPDEFMELELHVPVRQAVFLHELDDAPRLDLAEDGTDIDGTLRAVQAIDAQSLTQVGFIADDELQDVLRPELLEVLRQHTVGHVRRQALVIDSEPDVIIFEIRFDIHTAIGLDVDAVPLQSFQESVDILAQRFAARQGDVGIGDLGDDIGNIHMPAFIEGISRIAVRTAQVAAAEADERRQLAGFLPFPVDAVENLVDTEAIIHKWPRSLHFPGPLL